MKRRWCVDFLTAGIEDQLGRRKPSWPVGMSRQLDEGNETLRLLAISTTRTQLQVQRGCRCVWQVPTASRLREFGGSSLPGGKMATAMVAFFARRPRDSGKTVQLYSAFPTTALTLGGKERDRRDCILETM